MKKYNTKLLPSYVVFKCLAESKKNEYDMLNHFILVYLKQNSLYKFTIVQLQKQINEYYGFKLPASLIKQSIKGISGIRVDKIHYSIKPEILSSVSLIDYDSDEKLDFIYDELKKYIEDKTQRILSNNDFELLKQDLLNFYNVGMESSTNIQYIPQFIIQNQYNKDIISVLDDIEQGCLIYKGITSDIKSQVQQENSSQSWTSPLDLYLNTDVLFDMRGYNGTLYQSYALDFIKLIDEINQKHKYINLKFFRITKCEIDRFFAAAKYVYVNKKVRTNDAMEYILDSVKNVTDIEEEKTLFYSMLEKYNIEVDFETSIKEEKEDDYLYEEIGIQYEDSKYGYQAYEQSKNVYTEYTNDYYLLISKLRDDKKTNFLRDAKTIFIARKGDILKLAHDKAIGKNIPFALSVEYLTTSFWFILNKGFGECDKPKSFDVINRSKMIYSSLISDEKQKKITEVQENYKEKGWSDEDAYKIIINLKKIPSKPENVDPTTDIQLLNDDLVKIKEDLDLRELETNQRLENAEKQRELAMKKAEEQEKYALNVETEYREKNEFLEKQKNEVEKIKEESLQKSKEAEEKLQQSSQKELNSAVLLRKAEEKEEKLKPFEFIVLKMAQRKVSQLDSIGKLIYFTLYFLIIILMSGLFYLITFLTKIILKIDINNFINILIAVFGAVIGGTIGALIKEKLLKIVSKFKEKHQYEEYKKVLEK